MDTKKLLIALQLVDALETGSKKEEKKDNSIDNLLSMLGKKEEPKKKETDKEELLKMLLGAKEEPKETKQNSELGELIALLKGQAEERAKEPSIEDILRGLVGKGEKKAESVSIQDFLKAQSIQADDKQKDQVAQLVAEMNKYKEANFNMKLDSLIEKTVRESGLPYDAAIGLINKGSLKVDPETQEVTGLTEQINSLKALVGNSSSGMNFGVTPTQLHVADSGSSRADLAKSVLAAMGKKVDNQG